MALKNKNKFFEEIRDGMEGLIDDLRQDRPLTEREVDIPEPATMTADKIIRLRKKTLKVSQHVFARLINVAPQTVQAWEQGRNLPTSATLRLLELSEANPNFLLGTIKRNRPKTKSPDRRTAIA
jgi:putative transcriptional regulator